MKHYVIIINLFLFHSTPQKKVEEDDVDEQMKEINKEMNKLKRKYGENYGEVIRCIIFHENILQYVQKQKKKNR